MEETQVQYKKDLEKYGSKTSRIVKRQDKCRRKLKKTQGKIQKKSKLNTDKIW